MTSLRKVAVNFLAAVFVVVFFIPVGIVFVLVVAVLAVNELLSRSVKGDPNEQRSNQTDG